MAATYTVKQVAEILGYSTNSIYTFLKEKRIEGVRVGKGRFRIPQSELNRLLLISKGQAGAGKETGSMVPMTGTIILPDTGIITPHQPHVPLSFSFLGRTRTMTSNIFDWFLGISAVVTGIALFLFNQTFDTIHIQSVAPTLSAIRILFIGGGIGILLTNITYNAHKTWYKVFQNVLVVACTSMMILMVMTRDIDGAAIYGTLAMVIALTIFFHWGRIIPFALYITLLAVTAPIVVLAVPEDYHVLALTNALHVTSIVAGIGLSCLSFGFIVLLWLGIYRKKALFWFSSYTAAIVYFILAFWLAYVQFWSLAFFLMVVALTCMYLPSWDDLCMLREKKVHALAIGVFVAIMGVILIGITVVYVTQRNVITTVERENAQKVDYARTEMESDIESVKSTVTTASINPELVAAVSNKNITALTDLSRIMFDSSNNIRRLAILDTNGLVLFMYPLGQIGETDLSFRDYFIQARDTGRLYVSDIFEALGQNSQRKAVTISAPLISADKQFVGVLAASLDLDAISARLQKIAVVDRGEYIVVLDSHGKRIMHPVSSLIGTDTETTDPTRLGIQGKTGVAEGDTYDGIHSLISYTSINSLHWAIALKAPYNSIYALSSAANVIVAGLIIGCIMIVALIFQLNYIYKYKSLNDGGSP
jgi:excisionase family DNA binding protein